MNYWKKTRVIATLPPRVRQRSKFDIDMESDNEQLIYLSYHRIRDENNERYGILKKANSVQIINEEETVKKINKEENDGERDKK